MRQYIAELRTPELVRAEVEVSLEHAAELQTARAEIAVEDVRDYETIRTLIARIRFS